MNHTGPITVYTIKVVPPSGIGSHFSTRTCTSVLLQDRKRPFLQEFGPELKLLTSTYLGNFSLLVALPPLCHSFQRQS